MLPGCDQEVFLRIQKWQEKCFGVTKVAKKVFLSWREWQKKCFDVEGVAKNQRQA